MEIDEQVIELSKAHLPGIGGSAWTDPRAEVVVGGERPPLERGFYVAPTLLAECGPDNPAVQQEFFGPVVSVVPFDGDDDAATMQ